MPADHSSRRLLVATTNRKKLEELRSLLCDLELELVYLKDFGDIREVPETGDTFRENALLKAKGYAKQTGLMTLAEDSGLCCDALEGAPGVKSARFSGPSKNDQDNNFRVLDLLKNVQGRRRSAYFKSVVAIAMPGKVVGIAEGVVHGMIASEARGPNGFGYDPIFYYPPFSKTFGEVDALMKHQVSHRAQALQKAKTILQKYFETHRQPTA